MGRTLICTTKLISPGVFSGHAGEVVEVKAGYARSYLVPRGFAAKWTAGAQKQIDQIARCSSPPRIATIDDARAVRTLPVPLSNLRQGYGGPAACSAPSPPRSLVKEQLGPGHRRRRVIASPIKRPLALHGDRRPAPRIVRERKGPAFPPQ